MRPEDHGLDFVVVYMVIEKSKWRKLTNGLVEKNISCAGENQGLIDNQPSLGTDLGLVYTGLDKVLLGQNLARFHPAFTWDRQNWTDFWTAKCASLGPALFRSQTCTLSRSKIRPVPPVLCKRRVEPYKFLSEQKFVRTRVNVASKVQWAGTLGQRWQLYYTALLYFISFYLPSDSPGSACNL